MNPNATAGSFRMKSRRQAQPPPSSALLPARAVCRVLQREQRARLQPRSRGEPSPGRASGSGTINMFSDDNHHHNYHYPAPAHAAYDMNDACQACGRGGDGQVQLLGAVSSVPSTHQHPRATLAVVSMRTVRVESGTEEKETEKMRAKSEKSSPPRGGCSAVPGKSFSRMGEKAPGPLEAGRGCQRTARTGNEPIVQSLTPGVKKSG